MAVLTIIMSTYNRRAFLPTAIRSLLAQTFRDWRLLIVNDGGEDVSDLIATYADPRIEYFNRPHLGKAAQLNFALGLVTSKYIGYMDDDDVALPEHFRCLYEAAEATGREFVYTNVQPVVLNPDGTEELWPVNDTDVTWKDIRIDNSISHSTVLHTKRLAEEVGPYDERMRVLIDHDYIKRLAAKVEPFHVHVATYRWNLRKDAEGNINSISGLWTSDPLAAGRSLLAFFEKDPESLTIFRLARSQLKRQAAAEKQARVRFAAECDHLSAERDRLMKDFARICDERDHLIEEFARTRTERDWLAADRERLLNSTCWKITAPIRWVLDQIKHRA